MGVASREHSTVAVKLPPKGKAAPLTLRRYRKGINSRKSWLTRLLLIVVTER